MGLVVSWILVVEEEDNEFLGQNDLFFYSSNALYPERFNFTSL